MDGVPAAGLGLVVTNVSHGLVVGTMMGVVVDAIAVASLGVDVEGAVVGVVMDAIATVSLVKVGVVVDAVTIAGLDVEAAVVGVVVDAVASAGLSLVVANVVGVVVDEVATTGLSLVVVDVGHGLVLGSSRLVLETWRITHHAVGLC